MQSEYLDFVRIGLPGRKTPITEVYSAKSGGLLGEIKWFGRWRQYAFFPEPGTVWNPDCLDTVNERIRALMAERKA